MRHILVLTDFSEASKTAFPVARQQVEHLPSSDYQLTVLHIVEDMPAATYHLGLGEDIKSIWADLDVHAQQALTQLTHEHLPNLLPNSTIVEAQPGVSLAREVARFCRSHHVSLIIMATHGRSGVSRFINGSLTERLLRQLPCPVLVVPAGPEAKT